MWYILKIGRIIGESSFIMTKGKFIYYGGGGGGVGRGMRRLRGAPKNYRHLEGGGGGGGGGSKKLLARKRGIEILYTAA